MVNKSDITRSSHVRRLGPLVTGCVGGYVVVVVATIVALAALSAAGSDQASSDAWIHAVIVAAFAVLLPARLRAARRGSARGVRAVGIIATVLLVVNVVEACLPDLFPVWMRVEMIGIAVLMVAVVIGVRRGEVR